MKLMVRFRGVPPTATMLDHVKEVLGGALVALQATRASILLVAEGDLVECRVEVGLARGAVWVVRAASDDALHAVEAAGDRLATRVPCLNERAAPRHAA